MYAAPHMTCVFVRKNKSASCATDPQARLLHWCRLRLLCAGSQHV